MEYTIGSKAEGKITLYAADGKRLGETFTRRARQLVKQQRAVWTDEGHTAVRFLPDAPEEWETGAEYEGEASIPLETDKTLLAVAKKRLSTRRWLYLHTLALVPGYIFFAITADVLFWQTTTNHFIRGAFIGSTFTLWTVMYVFIIYQFVRHNRGFFPFANSEKRRALRLEREVERLKRMGYGG